MECPRCQAENREGARFCRECGARFGVVCSGWEATVQAGSKLEAHALLAGVYAWPTEGFDTADLQEAKALLEELA